MKLFVVVASAAFVATPALAHAHLMQETPAAGAVVALAPAALVLDFSEDVQLAFTGVVVTGPDKAAVGLRTATVGGDGKELTVPFADKLAPGLYTTAWHALAKDGHKTHGAYSFTVK